VADEVYQTTASTDYAEDAVFGYVLGSAHCPDRAQLFVPRILDLLAKIDNRKELFGKLFENQNSYIYLPWIPQIIAGLPHTE
jgi:hypothetical protein